MGNQIEKAIEILKDGGVIAYPTDTTYGIGCDATNKEAVKQIFELKGRDFNKPLGLAFSDVEMIKEYCEVSKNDEKILRKLFPGPFMVLLNKKDNISDLITAKRKKVGVRIPDHEIVQDLIRGLSKPIITTSANISGERDPIEASEVELKVGLVVVGGCQHKVASTVIDLERKKILRNGPKDDLALKYLV